MKQMILIMVVSLLLFPPIQATTLELNKEYIISHDHPVLSARGIKIKISQCSKINLKKYIQEIQGERFTQEARALLEYLHYCFLSTKHKSISSLNIYCGDKLIRKDKLLHLLKKFDEIFQKNPFYKANIPAFGTLFFHSSWLRNTYD